MIKRFILSLLRFYQRQIGSRYLCCRFVPTCSEYAYLAVERYGVWRGGYLATRRLLRCHRFYRGSWADPLS